MSRTTKPRKRLARRDSCRYLRLGGTVARVHGRHPMGKRNLEALDVMVRAAMKAWGRDRA